MQFKSKTRFVCGSGGERWVAKSHSSFIRLFLTKTLEHKNCLFLADDEVNHGKVNNKYFKVTSKYLI